MSEAVKKVIETIEEIEAGEDIEYALVPGYKEDESFRIGSLTAGDMIEWAEANEGDEKRTAGLRLITKSLVNTKGVRYATDPKNLAVFRKKNHKTTERIVMAILELNGMNVKKDNEAKKD